VLMTPVDCHFHKYFTFFLNFAVKGLPSEFQNKVGYIFAKEKNLKDVSFN